MGLSRLRAIAFVMATSSCGLALGGDLGANDGGTPGTETDAAGGSNDGGPTPNDGAGIIDTVADTSSSESGTECVTIVQGFPAGKWEALGVAVINANNVVLTAATQNSTAGAAWYRDPITFATTLRITVNYTIETPSGPAGDGLTIAWIETTPKYVLGLANQNFGLCNQGLVGTGIAADSFDGQLIGLGGCSANCQTTGAIVTAPTVGSHKLDVTVSAAQIVGSLDNNSFTVTRTRANAKTGYLGLTASTGNGDSRHTITSIRADSCP